MALSQIDQLAKATLKARKQLKTSVCTTVEIWSYEDGEGGPAEEVHFRVWYSCGKTHTYHKTVKEALAQLEDLAKLEGKNND